MTNKTLKAVTQFARLAYMLNVRVLFSGVMSRLDRLFTLLSTSSSSSARHLAARQLGEVQRLHPHELHSLLARIHPLLRSSSWDTRFANCLSIKMAYFAGRLKQVRGGI